MMYLIVFLFPTLLAFVAGSAPPCVAPDNSVTKVEVAFSATSTFRLTINNFPSGYCSVGISKWNGDNTQNFMYLQQPCDQISNPIQFSKMDITDTPDIQYGLEFVFALYVFDDSSYSNNMLCSTKTVFVPPLCFGGNGKLTVLNLVKRPFDSLSVSLTNRPPTGYCFYLQEEWDGTESSLTTLADNCGSVTLASSGFLTDTRYKVGMVVLSTDTFGSDQPICGMQSVNITIPSCPGSLALTDSALDALSVAISSANPGMKCEVYLSLWNGVDVTPQMLTRVSTDCSSVIFPEAMAGMPLMRGTGYAYAAYYAEFPTSIHDTSQTNPSCVTASAYSNTISDFTACPHSGVFSFSGLGLHYFIVYLNHYQVKPYGVCEVRIVSLDSVPLVVAAQPAARPCFDTFYFDITGLSGRAEINYSFFPDGNPLGQAACVSASAFYQIGIYFSCPGDPVNIDDSTIGALVFTIGDLEPQVGSCTLSTNKNGHEFIFPSCDGPLRISFDELTAAIPELGPGEAIEFTWNFYDSSSTSTPYCQAPTPTSYVPLVLVPLTVTSTTSGQVIATIPSVPASLSTGSFYCRANLLLSDAIAPSGPQSYVDLGSCSDSLTFTGITYVPDGAILRMQMSVYSDHDLSNLVGHSPIVTAVASAVPDWGAFVPLVQLYGDDCVSVTWKTDGITSRDSPVLSFRVERKDGSAGTYRTVNQASASVSSYLACSLSVGIAYTFRVFAVNVAGPSSPATADPFYLERNFAAAASVINAPDPGGSTHVAGEVPTLSVQRYQPLASPIIDTVTTECLFVGRLVNRCKLDSDTGTIAVPLSPGDNDYSDTSLPIGYNQAPFFTVTFSSAGSGLYTYESTPQPPAGAYSLLVYSLEVGGLLGQYWSSTALSGSPVVTRKDPVMNLTLPGTVRAARWTGFIESSFGETFTFTVAASGSVRLWVNDVFVINRWDALNLCSGTCSGTVPLSQSASPDRVFQYVRLDFSSPTTGSRIKLSWNSASQPLQVVPTTNTFKGVVVGGSAVTVDVTPSSASAAMSTFTVSPGPYFAGSSFVVTVTPRDAYGSAVTTTGSIDARAHFQGIEYMGSPNNDGTIRIDISSSTRGDNIPVYVQDSMGTDLVNSGGVRVSIITGPPSVVVATISGSLPAGQRLPVEIEVQDNAGNAIQPPSADVNIFGTASWVNDPSSALRLPVDDVGNRTAEYGIQFNATSFEVENGALKAYFDIPLAGVYDLSLGVTGGANPQLGVQVTVTAIPESVGYYGVIVADQFPPSNAQVNVPISFTVQFRDRYQNTLIVDPSGDPPTVVLRLGAVDVTCSGGSGSAGQVSCGIIPFVAGDSLVLDVRVDGISPAYLYLDDGSLVQSVRGPWTIAVAPGDISVSHSTLTGIRQSYVAGEPVWALLTPRDSRGNPVGSTSPPPSVTASIASPAGTDSMDTVLPNGDGSWSIKILALTACSPCTLEIDLGGTPVTLPYGIDGSAVTVYAGPISPTNTVCSSLSQSETVGAVGSITCHPVDKGNNVLVLPYLYTYAYFATQSDSYTVNGVYSASDGSYSYSADSLPDAGVYQYNTMFGRPGGLMAQYFGTADFGSLMGPLGGGDAPVERDGYGGSVTYTRIQPYLSFSFPGSWSWGGSTVGSAVWLGYWLPPVTGTYHISLTAFGGAEIFLGGQHKGGALGDSSTSLGFIYPTSGQYPIQIEVHYLPTSGGGATGLSLEWEFDGPISGPYVIPPSAFLSMLAARPTDSSIELTAPTTGPPSASDSTLTGMLSQYTVGVSVDMTLILRDSSGTPVGPLDSYPTIAVFFTDNSNSQMTMDPSSFTYSSVDGSITLPVLATTASDGGTFSLSVQVDGTDVPAPNGIDSAHIVVTTGILSAAGTTCDWWWNFQAGSASTMHCTPGDSYGHPIAWPNMYVKSFFTNFADLTVGVLGVASNSADTSYVLTRSAGVISTSGWYFHYTVVGQPGGLFAEYYSDSSFSTLIAQDSNGPATEPQYGGILTYSYTQIDSTVSLSNSGAMILNSDTVASIRWKGLLIPPSSATSFTVSVVATGAVQIYLDGQLRVDLASASPASGSYMFTPISGESVDIIVEYVPSSAASIQLKCVYPGSIPSTAFVIPESMLLAPINAGGQYQFAVHAYDTMGPVSTWSEAFFSGATTIQTPGKIYVRLYDNSQQPFEGIPPSCVSNSPGSVPDCLIAVTVASGTGVTVSAVHDNHDGQLYFVVTALATGTKVFNVELQLSSGYFSPIVNSPLSVTYT